MKNNILKLIIVLSVVLGCNNNNNNFILNINTDRVGDAILLKIDPKSNTIDTTSIKNGSFKFKKNIQEEELFRLKFFDGTSFDLVIQPGENIKINYTGEKLSIQGSIGSEKLLEIEDQLAKLILYRDSITKELQNLSTNDNFEEKMLEYRALFFEKLNDHKLILKEFIKENGDSKISLIALFQSYGNASPVLNIDDEIEIFETVLNNLRIHFPKSNHIELLESQIQQAKPIATGAIAPEFTMPDVDNKNISLSNFRGKVVLIDFWASWCKPCRIANPKLVELYNKYKQDGFEIISISLDGTPNQKDPKKQWLEAIKEDNITWTNLSELNGWQNSIRALYNFNSIPYTVLIDKSGKIIGKNLELELEQKIIESINYES